jgi:hypothetical protein
MKLFRNRMSIRWAMSLSVVASLGLVSLRDWQERQAARARLATQQRLIRAIGAGNNASQGLRSSADYGRHKLSTYQEMQRAEEELRKIEAQISAQTGKP